MRFCKSEWLEVWGSGPELGGALSSVHSVGILGRGSGPLVGHSSAFLKILTDFSSQL